MLAFVTTWIGLGRLRASIGHPAALGAVFLTLLVPLETTAAEGLSETTRPFTVGERLTYEVSWLNLTAAIAVMEVAPTEGRGGTASLAKLIGTAQSTPIITKFFPVDNRVESELDLETLTPEHLTFRRREGKRKRISSIRSTKRTGRSLPSEEERPSQYPFQPGHTTSSLACTTHVPCCHPSREPHSR